jgi:hypothetical protein
VKLGDGGIFRFDYLFDSQRNVLGSAVCVNGQRAAFRFDDASRRWEQVNSKNAACQ